MVNEKRRTMLLLSLAELLAVSVWFSASAVVPALTDAWGLNDSGKAWLTMSVQIGFLCGHSPVILGMVAVIWGVAAVADSAQFSACVSELADRKIMGTALTLQTSLEFLLTLRQQDSAVRLGNGHR